MNEEQIKQLQEEAGKAVEKAVEKLQGTLTKEQSEKLETLKTELNTQIQEATKDFQNEESVKQLIEESTQEALKEIKELEKVVEEQGKQIKGDGNGSNIDLLKEFNAVQKDVYENGKLEQNQTIKDGSADTMTVSNVDATTYPDAGGTQVIGSGISLLFGKVIGWFKKKRPMSMILDLVDFMPLDGSDTLIIIEETITGTAEYTPECALKPVVKSDLKEKSVTANPVAVYFRTTTRLRKFYARVVNSFRNSYEELIMEAIPKKILEVINDEAVAFTPIPELAIHSDPNNYDVVGAVLASLENLGYGPNGIIMHPVAWRNMVQSKGTDGHYNLQNGGSINIAKKGLEWDGIEIPVYKDPTIGYDEFIIGDLFASVKAGIDNELIYREGYDRSGDLQRNILAHVLEKFVAVAVPDEGKTGIVKDTFSNAKTLITA